MQVTIDPSDLPRSWRVLYERLVEEYGEEVVAAALEQAAAEAARQQIRAFGQKWVDDPERIEERLVANGVLDAEEAAHVSE